MKTTTPYQVRMKAKKEQEKAAQPYRTRNGDDAVPGMGARWLERNDPKKGKKKKITPKMKQKAAEWRKAVRYAKLRRSMPKNFIIQIQKALTDLGSSLSPKIISNYYDHELQLRGRYDPEARKVLVLRFTSAKALVHSYFLHNTKDYLRGDCNEK